MINNFVFDNLTKTAKTAAIMKCFKLRPKNRSAPDSQGASGVSDIVLLFYNSKMACFKKTLFFLQFSSGHLVKSWLFIEGLVT